MNPGGGNVTYTNQFTCIPDALPFRPARRTPLPTIPGTQSAFVVGPAGAETFADEFGRVKVQFHWDREGKNDEHSSCWIRVAMPPGAAPTPPAIGTEVIVAFEEGDPGPADHRRHHLQRPPSPAMTERGEDVTRQETSRRGILGRGLLLLGGLGAAAGGRLAFEHGVKDGSLVLYGRNWRGYGNGRSGGLPLEGDRISVRGELLAQPGGEPVGEFFATAFALGGAAHPAQSERLELHTFKLREGTIFGTGTAGGMEEAFAVQGGTGRFAGAQGTYVARQAHTEPGGDGGAEFVFALRA